MRIDLQPMGLSKPAYALPRGAEVEDIVNRTALAVVDAEESQSKVVQESENSRECRLSQRLLRKQTGDSLTMRSRLFI